MIKSGSKMKTKIYYESQTNWTKDEYYYLHRYFIGCYFIMKSIAGNKNVKYRKNVSRNKGINVLYYKILQL